MIDSLHIIFAPLLPLELLQILGLLAMILSALALYRRARGSFLRLALFALILLALANPSLIRETREPLKDTALVVIDDSASMRLANRSTEAAKAADALAAKLASFTDLDVETLHVGGEDETDLFTAIDQKRKQIPADRLAGIIAITDGQIHDASTLDSSTPFHALLVGQPKEADRRLTIKSAPAYGIVGQQATLTFRVDDEPEKQSPTANLSITRDDGTSENITVPVGQDVDVKTEIKHGGANALAFDVEALPGELTPINNAVVTSINGVRDRLRVLLISAEPAIGVRQWLNLLRSDADIDLFHFTFLRSPFKDNSIPNRELSLIAFPAKEVFETRLHKFDLVIFDGFSNRVLVNERYLTNIANYVEQGGALLVSNATGAQALLMGNSPLARVLPAHPNGDLLTGAFVPALNEAGQRHPVTSTLEDNLPHRLWGPWYRQIDARIVTQDSEVVMTGIDQKPLMVLAHVGKGRVAQFLSNQFWLWERQYPQGGPETEMLRRTAHWLMKEPELDESALTASAEKTDQGWQLHINKKNLHGNEANVIVTGPDQQPVQVKLTPGTKAGILQASKAVQQAGLYHVKDAPPSNPTAMPQAAEQQSAHEVLVMAGTANTPEFHDMVATEDKVAAAAKISGGSVKWLNDFQGVPDIRRTHGFGSQSGSDWIGLKQNGQYRVTGSNATPLWPAWAALALLLVVAMLMWRREGR